ncbi:hypothetical protein Tco_1478252, partial [Tanacetum coccineum]
MSNLKFADTHNMIAFLVQLQALVDRKKIIITELIVRRDLQLDDEEGTKCLPNATIFEELTRIGSKTTTWNEFSSTMASANICLATNQKFNFSKYIFEIMVKKLDNVGKFLVYPRSRRPKRKDTEIPQSSIPSNNVADEAVNEEKTQFKATPNEPSSLGTSSGGNRLRSGEGSMQLNELMEFCTNVKQRVLDLKNTKTSQDQEITSLKQRVKKLEKKGWSRTYKLKRLYKVGISARIVSSDEASLGDQEDASKHGRKIDNIDKDVEITLVDETQGRYGDDIMFDVSDLASEEVFVVEQGVTNSKKDDVVSIADAATIVSTASTIPVSVASITDVEITLAQALAELKSAKPTTADSTRPKAKGIVMQEPSESTPTISSQQPSQIKVQ